MSWYYAENNERRGPIENAAFDALVTQGTVRPDTLVWREGMDNWVALSASGYRPGFAAAPASAPDASPRPGTEMGVCSESGRILPRSELIEINGRLVSAEYKNIVLQRMREGVGASGLAADPEALAQMIEQRGYDISIGSCIARGWGLIKSRFWLTIGAVFLVTLINQAAGMLPLVGQLVVFGPLTAGLYWIMILILRNETVSIGDTFVGFNRGFGQYLGFTAVFVGAVIACLLPGVGLVLGGGAMSSAGSGGEVLMGIGGLLAVGGFVVAMYLWTSWVFALPLIADKQIEFWPAMKLSKRIVGMHWWSIFGVIFCTSLVMMAVIVVFGIIVAIGAFTLIALQAPEGIMVALGILAAFVLIMAVFAMMPLSYATVAVAYEEVFGQREQR